MTESNEKDFEDKMIWLLDKHYEIGWMMSQADKAREIITLCRKYFKENGL